MVSNYFIKYELETFKRQVNNIDLPIRLLFEFIWILKTKEDK